MKKVFCCDCKKELKKEKEQYVYFDSANKSITKSCSNKIYCKDCYKKRWSY